MISTEHLIFFLGVALASLILIISDRRERRETPLWRRLVWNCFTGIIPAVVTTIYGYVLDVYFSMGAGVTVILILAGFPGYVLLLIYFNFFN